MFIAMDRRNKEDDTYNCPSPSAFFKFGSQEGSNIGLASFHSSNSLNRSKNSLNRNPQLLDSVEMGRIWWCLHRRLTPGLQHHLHSPQRQQIPPPNPLRSLFPKALPLICHQFSNNSGQVSVDVGLKLFLSTSGAFYFMFIVFA
ncbi:uncharacterized protein [Malus domestica]|uniref:uncharacterized protein isoform X2 n=1 Tax=Malus domestica TaxID=3750 RepID=UPI003975E480